MLHNKISMATCIATAFFRMSGTNLFVLVIQTGRMKNYFQAWHKRHKPGSQSPYNGILK